MASQPASQLASDVNWIEKHLHWKFTERGISKRKVAKQLVEFLMIPVDEEDEPFLCNHKSPPQSCKEEAGGPLVLKIYFLVTTTTDRIIMT